MPRLDAYVLGENWLLGLLNYYNTWYIQLHGYATVHSGSEFIKISPFKKGKSFWLALDLEFTLQKMGKNFIL